MFIPFAQMAAQSGRSLAKVGTTHLRDAKRLCGWLIG
jgi:hypothetical protein